MRFFAALVIYGVIALVAAQTLTAKIPVGDHAVELRVVVWVVLGAFALLTYVHRKDRSDSASSGDK